MTEHPDSERPRDPIAAAVQFIAAQPGGPARLLTIHRPKDDARTCAGCGARWPCSIAHLAEKARTYRR